MKIRDYLIAMMRLAHITRITPLAILLSLGLLIQSLVISQHGHASALQSNSTYDAIIICVEGELREIFVRNDENPAEKSPLMPHCPFCLAAEHTVLDLPPETFSFRLNSKKENIRPTSIRSLELLNVPEQPNCLDPPGLA